MKTKDITIKQFRITHGKFDAITHGNDRVCISLENGDSLYVSKKDIPDLIAILQEVMRIEGEK